METTVKHSMWSLVFAPFTGLAYVILLPLVAISVVAGIAITKIVEPALGTLATVVSFGWRPVEAYLTGRKTKKGRRL
ncbi:MAG TPA: hypothetical protein DCP92_10840 [Nitrospiraceae bacterium]|jgi:hypothetical protein|nr:hypothetical protein [Nitrospiraceae bacterium]